MDAFHFRERAKHGSWSLSTRASPHPDARLNVSPLQRNVRASRLSASKLATASGALRRMSDVPVSCGMMDRPIPANMQYCARSVANWYPCIKSALGGKRGGLLAFTGYSVTRRCVHQHLVVGVLVTHPVAIPPPQCRLSL